VNINSKHIRSMIKLKIRLPGLRRSGKIDGWDLIRFLVIFLVLHLPAYAYGQERKISMDLQQVSVDRVIEEIRRKSEYSFLYRSDLFDGSPLVNALFTEAGIGEILDEILVPLGFSYEIEDQTIVIRKRKSTPSPREQADLQKEIRGTVRGKDGKGIPGVNVVVRNTSLGTITDLDGNFRLSIPGHAKVLVFSFVGMRTQEVQIQDRTEFSIVLEESDISLDEVVVIGYGTQKKSDITGAVASVSKERIEGMVSTDVAQIIQGSVPGLVMMSTEAGAAQTSENSLILIRGRNSITADNSPLIVLDGVPYEGDLGDLNPNDLASIEVLKDASSSAIYGSRGANGVILITSRTGQEGKLEVVYDGYVSIQQVANFPHIMNGEEYYDYKKNWVDEGGETGEGDASISDSEREIYESGQYTDWRKELLRTGSSHRHNLSISGGSKTVKWINSTSYLGIRGVAVNDNYERLTNRLSINADVASWLKLGTSTQLSYSDKSGNSPSFSAVYRMSPLVKAYNDDGSINITPLPDNPLKKSPLEDLLYDDVDKTYQVILNNYAEIDFPWIDGLSYRVNAALRYSNSTRIYYAGMNTVAGKSVNSEGSITGGPYISTVLENVVSYKREFGKHSLFLTGLYSYEGKKRDITTTYAKAFPNDFMKWYGMSQANYLEETFQYEQENLISQMLRLNYSYDNRYLFTLTARRDGFSGFGRYTKWGVFPSLAIGWNVSSEGFYNIKDVMNALKIRFSYGENGNQAVQPYQSIDRLEVLNYVNGSVTAPGYVPSDMGVPDLGWESTRSMNFGIDYAFIHSRIYGDFNIYNNNTYDLLLDRRISPVHGDDKITQNIGKTNNRGLEFSVASTNIRQNNFTWTMGANLALQKNKIVALQYGDSLDDISSKLFIGQPITSNFDYNIIGVWQLDQVEVAAMHGALPGYARYEDFKRDSLLTPEDRRLIGHTDPSVTWGLTNTFKYRSLRLSVFIYGMHGFIKANPLKQANVNIIYNWWTPDNPTNDMWDKDDRMANAYWVDGGVDVYEHADFVRFKDITLNYDLPAQFIRNIGLENATVYLSGKNLVTLTRYEGMDPELDTQRAVPLQKEYILGIKIAF
jgi:TonB-linked SusC/RagA family outer membrane protein